MDTVGSEVPEFILCAAVYVDREEAWTIAEAASQIARQCGGGPGTLFSEHLY